MGRTKRRRNKTNKTRNCCLDNDPNIINLRKFMARNGWINDTTLRLYDFPETGRGVASTKTLNPHDTLIRIPYNLMITFTTLQSLEIDQLLEAGAKLTIHDFLALFLIVEKQKRSDSYWWCYIDSLPPQPPPLPWFLPSAQINSLPVELRGTIMKARRLFEESWNRVQKSIKRGNVACLLDVDLFLWAYSMVNTRAVYVEPCTVRKLCTIRAIDGVLSDEPCMALCPYLDMFNHSHETCTNAGFLYNNNEWFYQLVTMSRTHKFQQVFISYGNHDNYKLLVEYGFFIPGNRYDCVSFTKDEIIKNLGLNLNNFQYKFIIEHNLDDYHLLYLNQSGISFNLKAFLFVCCSKDERKLSSIIYRDSYPEEFQEIATNYCKILLNHKLVTFENTFETLKQLESPSESFQQLCQFVLYWKRFIVSLFSDL